MGGGGGDRSKAKPPTGTPEGKEALHVRSLGCLHILQEFLRKCQVPSKGLRERGYGYRYIDTDVDMDADSDMAVSISWGSFERGLALLVKGFRVDVKQV